MDLESLFSVKDKVVLVTGGAKGIGRMISEAFVRNGARVYIASRDGKACDAAAAELNALPGKPSSGQAIAIPANLASLDDCKRLAEELKKRESKLHVLVNNSGATWGEEYEKYPDSAWTKLLTLNLHRVFTLTQLLTPLLEAAAVRSADGVIVDPARLIHIGSIDGIRVPKLPTFAYSSSKAGLHHLSRHLAVELGPRGITSNTLACGPFPSKMMAHTLKTFGEEIRAANPLGRIGLPSDVGGACLFLASKAGGFVNGATIRVDGGVSLQSKI
ncbi:reductase-like protein [Thermochaetoides thermophila DSM 1495]|uniref:Reductase-like protein n=1 Tax=Chaetomium thermophilum (strain DSM 1495 / CBS 144.50 / IMI 039719) TaxID=759272 RepID=G0SDF3_CHATD|nr:reductase-like protein [Thermochaetoides thermophila DSM 1495]EGS18554.1 reductase-like protein [Thermochaetoides thermophila DSM 1495]